jgi:hypothetical protein
MLRIAGRTYLIDCGNAQLGRLHFFDPQTELPIKA